MANSLIYCNYGTHKLGTPVVPFFPFLFRDLFIKTESGKKGALKIKGLLRNPEKGMRSFF